MSTSKTNQNSSIINVSISDYVLTPTSCAVLVNEVMKNLLYQRTQIPYPYTWLKNIVKKKRQSLEEGGEGKKKNFTLDKHYQTVSTAYDDAENVMSNIVKYFTYFGSSLKEIIFLIGVTPVCPKEVFTIKLSSLAEGHVERNHVSENSKKQSRILRSIFLKDIWMNLVENSLACCNTYTFLKLEPRNDLTNMCDDGIFIPCKPLFLSHKIKHTVINFNYSNAQVFSCCDNMEVFKDFSDVDTPRKYQKTENGECGEKQECWLQSTVLIRGFKDCFINKVSACELW